MSRAEQISEPAADTEAAQQITAFVPEQRRPSETEPTHRRLGAIALTAAKVAAYTGMVLLPPAGAITGVVLNPPTTEKLAAGVELTVKPNIGVHTSEASLGGTELGRSPFHLYKFGKDIGLNVGLDINHLDLDKKGLSTFDTNGQVDVKKVGAYLNSYAGDGAEIERITRHVVWDNERAALIGGGAMLALDASILALKRCHRRNQQPESESDRRTIQQYKALFSPEQQKRIARYHGGHGMLYPVIVATAIGLPVLGVAGNTLFVPHSVPRLEADAALDGTPLAGTEIPNPLIRSAVDSIYPAVNNYFSASAKYEHDADAKVKTWAELLPKDKNTTRWIVIDDLQGRSVNAQIAGAAASAWQGDVLADLGDTSGTGWSIESQPIDALMSAVKKSKQHITVLEASGEHDSPQTMQIAASRGITLAHKATSLAGNAYDPTPAYESNRLYDRTFTVKGIGKVLIGDMPLRAPLNDKIYAIDSHGNRIDETQQDALKEAAARLLIEACQTHPDWVLVHDWQIGRVIAESHCAGQVLDGRSYNLQGPTTYMASHASSYEFTIGSTGALKDSSFSLSLPIDAGVFEVVDYNRLTKKSTYRVISIVPESDDADFASNPVVNISVSAAIPSEKSYAQYLAEQPADLQLPSRPHPNPTDLSDDATAQAALTVVYHG